MQNPSVVLLLHMRGLALPVYGRVYFEDEAQDDAFIMALAPEEAVTLLAKRIGEEVAWRFMKLM